MRSAGALLESSRKPQHISQFRAEQLLDSDHTLGTTPSQPRNATPSQHGYSGKRRKLDPAFEEHFRHAEQAVLTTPAYFGRAARRFGSFS